VHDLRRKVIRLGEETFVVSLPSAWTQYHNIKKGDELEIEQEGSKLVLSPFSASKQQKVSINVSNGKPMIKRILGALYKIGYNEFEIQYQTEEELQSIKEVLPEFVGFEIIIEKATTVTIKNISHIIPDEFRNIHRKIGSVIITMAEDALMAAQKKDWDGLLRVSIMDLAVNRHADFCRRILNTIGHKVVKRVPPSYYLVEQLEKVGDSYRDLCIYCSTSKVSPSSSIARFHRNTIEFLKLFLQTFEKFGIQEVTEFSKMHYQLLGEFNQLFTETEKKELPILFHLKSAESDIFDMNGALLAEKL
jgi:phosphate uptake regulator